MMACHVQQWLCTHSLSASVCAQVRCRWQTSSSTRTLMLCARFDLHLFPPYPQQRWGHGVTQACQLCLMRLAAWLRPCSRCSKRRVTRAALTMVLTPVGAGGHAPQPALGICDQDCKQGLGHQRRACLACSRSVRSVRGGCWADPPAACAGVRVPKGTYSLRSVLGPL